MKKRPKVVAFDVVETLFSLEPLRGRFESVGLPGSILGEWFARLIRDAMDLDATGVYHPFREIARGTTEVVLAEHGVEPTSERVQSVLAGFADLPAHPDVAGAFKLLKEQGIRVITLTNGNAELTASLLKRNGLSDLVERTISIDEVRRWKPSREVYLHATKVMGVAPEQLAMVAVHSWDIQGAGRAGLTTAWASRREKRFHPLMGPPDVTGATLVEAARKLTELPEA